MHGRRKIWACLYLYVQGQRDGMYGRPADRAVAEVVTPIVHRALEQFDIRRYFFIRYREDGAHIRVRFRMRSEEEKELLMKVMIDWVRELSPGVCFKDDTAGRIPASPVCAMHWAEYEPEYERYGGERAIEVSEELFEVSSRISMPAVKEILERGDAYRVGRGIVASLAIVSQFAEEPKLGARVLGSYAAGLEKFPGLVPRAKDPVYRQAVETEARRLKAMVWDTFTASTYRHQQLGMWGELAHAFREGKKAIDDILEEEMKQRHNEKGTESMTRYKIAVSHIHMTNNRLGISQEEEAFLCSVCAHALLA